jgi:integrase/recombinase XerD
MAQARKSIQLPFAAWPSHDRRRWKTAFEPGADRFDRCGPGAHLRQSSQFAIKKGYARFLGFITIKRPRLLKRPIASRLDRDVLRAYVRWLSRRCRDTALVCYLAFLRYALGYLCPDEDWSWLRDITNRIAAQAKPRPPKNNLVTSEKLYALGIKLMNRAEKERAAGSSSFRPVFRYRDGLLIAMLAEIPLRRRTVTALRIGKHLVRTGNSWALEIPAEDVKTNRPLDFVVPDQLSECIDLYLEKFRPRIPGAGTHDYFWASNHQRPMHGDAISLRVKLHTRAAFGFAVDVQRFRTAAVTFWSSQDPLNVRGAKDLLAHTTFSTTEKFYIMARSRLAGRVLARVLESKQKAASPG